MKVNLGNYESAEVWLSVSGVEPGTSTEEIDDALETGKLAYERIRERMREKVAALRAEGGALNGRRSE